MFVVLHSGFDSEPFKLTVAFEIMSAIAGCHLLNCILYEVCVSFSGSRSHVLRLPLLGEEHYHCLYTEAKMLFQCIKHGIYNQAQTDQENTIV